MTREELMKKAFESIVEADEDACEEVLAEGKEMGISCVEMLREGFSKGMDELGEQFGRGDVFLPELIYATEVMGTATDAVDEELAARGEVTGKGKIVIATVEGDVHDIGKGICASMLRASGFEVYDLGKECPADDYIAKAEEVGADIIGSSALLTTTMMVQQEIENKLEAKGLKGKIKTMIGGSPVTDKWKEKIGATAYSEDAADCCVVAAELVKQQNC